MSKRSYRYKTSLLFPKHSFLTGLGSIFNVFGNYSDFNYSKSTDDVDSQAIANDWNMVGQDLKDVMKKNPPKKLESAY